MFGRSKTTDELIDLANAPAKLMKAEAKLAETGAEIAKLKAELTAVQAEAAKLQAENAKLKAEAATLQAECDRIKAQSQGELADVRAKLKEAQTVTDNRVAARAAEIAQSQGCVPPIAFRSNPNPSGTNGSEALWAEYKKLPHSERNAFYKANREAMHGTFRN